MTDPSPSAKRPSRMARLRRRLSGALALGVALVAIGLGYSAVASAGTPGARAASQPQQESLDVRKGRALYEDGCITCHGRNLQGVQDRGPSLIDRKSTRLNSSHVEISYAVFCLKKKKKKQKKKPKNKNKQKNKNKT